MLDKGHGEPISIGGVGRFGALGGIVGAGSSEQRTDSSSACALAGARGAYAASGTGIFFAVLVLRGGVGYERGHGGSASDGGTGVSTLPGCARADRAG